MIGDVMLGTNDLARARSGRETAANLKISRRPTQAEVRIGRLAGVKGGR